MKKTAATIIAILLVVLSITTAFAIGKPPVNKHTPKPSPTATPASTPKPTKDHEAKKAYRSALKLKKQTMQANHHELMKLRISVRTSLNVVKDILESTAESGVITPELEALLPEVKSELTAIITQLKATGNYGQLMRQINAANKHSKGGNYAEALAQLDKLIGIQNEQKAALQALKTRADALLAKVKAASTAVPPSPTPAPTETPAPTDSPLPTETPTESPAESPAA